VQQTHLGPSGRSSDQRKKHHCTENPGRLYSYFTAQLCQKHGNEIQGPPLTAAAQSAAVRMNAAATNT